MGVALNPFVDVWEGLNVRLANQRRRYGHIVRPNVDHLYVSALDGFYKRKRTRPRGALW